MREPGHNPGRSKYGWQSAGKLPKREDIMKFANEAFADEMPVFNFTEVRKAGFEIYPTPHREDVFFPDDVVRDESGNIIGCRALGKI